ncbi:MAG: hypothetical protein LBO71_07640 [Prevotellaceae bacterium]|jgi:hypothetical protein|nr:hypothetical protein [Prevotellaceae bacterium]
MFYDDDDDDDDKPDVRSLPIFKKGEEILDVARLIAGLFPEDNEQLQFLKDEMIVNASLLTAKVAGAEAVELYDLKMEAATFIRKAACDLKIMNHSLEMFGFENVEYFQIVRKLIEEYRLLFIEWVAGFDKWSYITDQWGLFNPPGVSPFDEIF